MRAAAEQRAADDYGVALIILQPPQPNGASHAKTILDAVYHNFNFRFSSAQTVTGTGMEFQAIATCIIGGVSLFGDSGSILGTLIGCIFLTVIENGMVLAHISGYWQQAVVGLIIVILALALLPPPRPGQSRLRGGRASSPLRDRRDEVDGR